MLELYFAKDLFYQRTRIRICMWTEAVMPEDLGEVESEPKSVNLTLNELFEVIERVRFLRSWYKNYEAESYESAERATNQSYANIEDPLPSLDKFELISWLVTHKVLYRVSN